MTLADLGFKVKLSPTVGEREGRAGRLYLIGELDARLS